MATCYEWTAELIDEHGDIADNAFADSLAELAAYRADGWTIGLVRSVFNRIDEDLENRQWAYPEDGVLPAEFDGGAGVPKRFQAEWRKFNG